MSGGSAPSWSLSAPIETLFEKPVALLAFEPITSSTNELYVISPVPVGSNFAITCDAPKHHLGEDQERLSRLPD